MSSTVFPYLYILGCTHARELVLLLESSTVTVTQIKHCIDHDPVLTKVHQFVHNG